MSQTKAQLLAPIGIITCPGLDVTVGGSSPFQVGSTGIITAVSASFSGDVAVGGTLTYEDVTNIDSVGLITARKGINVTAGVSTFAANIDANASINVSVDINANGNIIGDNSTNISGIASVTATTHYGTYYGSGANLTGIEGGGKAQGVAHGSIGLGTAVAVRSDGKFAAVTGTNMTGGTPAASGFSEVAFPSITYDSVNGKVIVVWQGYSDDDGYASVGTISGTTISWGSTVKWNGTTNSRPNTVCYDSTNERIVIVFREDSGNIKSCVGQVSGTSITFGSVVTIDSNSSNYYPDCAFDSTTGKVVVSWRRHTNNYGVAKVGTVSGNSISWGSEVAWTGVAIERTSLVCHDGYVVCVDQDKVNVGQISGTSITFGTMATIPDFGSGDATNIDVDPNTGIFLIQTKRSASSLITAIPATRSGTTLTFGTYKSLSSSSPNSNQTLCWAGGENKFFASFSSGSSGSGGMQSVSIQVNGSGTAISGVSSPYVFLGSNSGNDQADYADCTHAGGGKVVVFLANQANSRNGWYYAEQTRLSNAYVGSFVGLSNAAYTDGQTAKVSVTGAVSTNQSGLSTATRYFLNADGSLSDAEGDLVILVGDALSATSILLR